jgi:hypothetical protein
MYSAYLKNSCGGCKEKAELFGRKIYQNCNKRSLVRGVESSFILTGSAECNLEQLIWDIKCFEGCLVSC